MCKFNKIVSTLLLGLMVAGCDVEALPKDYEETYGAIDMADVYDTVRNGQGESALYNQVINTIAEKEITAANRLEELYSRVQEKIDDMIEDSYTDVDYELYPNAGYESVEEDKLRTYYLSQGYKLGEGNSESNVWNAKKVLTGEAVNTYISEKLKVFSSCGLHIQKINRPPPQKKWAEDLSRHLERRHTNGQKAHEKMFNIANN